MSGLRRLHEPWWMHSEIPLIAVDLSAYDGSGPSYPGEATECATPADALVWLKPSPA